MNLEELLKKDLERFYEKAKEEGLPEYLIVVPGMGFEGPIGMFWDTEDVPLDSIINALAELLFEVRRRGLDEEEILREARMRADMLRSTSNSYERYLVLEERSAQKMREIIKNKK